MFYEIRTRRLKNGAIPEYLKVVGEDGIAIQKKHLGALVGSFSSEIGPINEIVHIWGFSSLDDRQVATRQSWRRSGLAGLPAPDARSHRDGRQQIMSPAAFSPLGGTAPA